MSASTPLHGRRVLLTGASSGVGLAAVGLLADEGARLVVVARRDGDLRALIDEHGLDAHVIAADLGTREECERVVAEAVEHFGGLDLLISNAGAAVFGHVSEVHPDDFDRTVDVTFGAPVNLIRAALPHLRESRGGIIATGSLMTQVPLPSWSAYTSAKHALRGFLNTLAIEEREQGTGVTISMVHPGPIDTPLFAQATSATGHGPRVPPDAYRAETVAAALVAVAVRPRREVLLGGETLGLALLFRHARPLAERILMTLDRWHGSGTERAPTPGSLWTTDDRPTAVSGRIPARDSMLAPLQLGRRLLPAPGTPLKLAAHAVQAGMNATRLTPALARPRSEAPMPSHGAGADAPQLGEDTARVQT